MYADSCIMSKKEDFSQSVKYVESGSEHWYQAKFESRVQAETIRDSEEVVLHPSDDRRKRTIRLALSTPEKTLEQISKNAIDQPSPLDSV